MSKPFKEPSTLLLVLFILWFGFSPALTILLACFTPVFNEGEKMLLWMSFVFVFPIGLAQLGYLENKYPTSNRELLEVLLLPVVSTLVISWVLGFDTFTSLVLFCFSLLASRMLAFVILFFQKDFKAILPFMEKIGAFGGLLLLSMPVIIFSTHVLSFYGDHYEKQPFVYGLMSFILLGSVVENTRVYYSLFKED